MLSLSGAPLRCPSHAIAKILTKSAHNMVCNAGPDQITYHPHRLGDVAMSENVSRTTRKSFKNRNKSTDISESMKIKGPIITAYTKPNDPGTQTKI